MTTIFVVGDYASPPQTIWQWYKSYTQSQAEDRYQENGRTLWPDPNTMPYPISTLSGFFILNVCFKTTRAEQLEKPWVAWKVRVNKAVKKVIANPIETVSIKEIDLKKYIHRNKHHPLQNFHFGGDSFLLHFHCSKCFLIHHLQNMFQNILHTFK